MGAEEEEALSPLYAILCTAAVQWLLYSTARCAPVTCGSVLSGCWYSEDVLTEAPTTDTKYQGRHQDGGPEHMPQGHSGGLRDGGQWAGERRGGDERTGGAGAGAQWAAQRAFR